MARSIPEDIIARVKNSANIVDVIGEAVILKKAGRNFQGLCPFHAEKTPSFSVSPEKQIFHCFGCNTGGNVFSFLMQHEGISFPESVRALAGKYGIQIPAERMTPAEKAMMSEREQLFKINENALSYFQRNLRDPQIGQKAMGYLLGRGMTRKIIDGYELGFAPELWDGVLRHLRQQHIAPEMAAKAGLVISRKDNTGYYDRFRNRVIFPIFNDARQVIGFGGRVMGVDLPKYLNSPETPLYNKSRSLYGLDKARPAVRKKGTVYLVEGYFDVLAMHLYGFENTVATLGTALTPEHVQILKGMVGNGGHIVLVYDSDLAGVKAAHRSITLFEQGFVDARILILPQGHDPDTFLREKGPQDFQREEEKSLAIIPFLFESAIQEHGLSVEGKVKIVAAIQAPLAAIQDNVARALYIKQIAERLDIDESVIMEKIRHLAATTHQRLENHAIDRMQIPNNEQRIEQQVIAMMIGFPNIIAAIKERNLLECFENQELRTIAHMIVEQHTHENRSMADLISMVENPRDRNMISRLAFMDDRWDPEGCDRLLNQFESRHRRRKIEDLQQQIIKAEKNNDIDLLSRLLKEKQKQAGKGRIH